MVELYEIDPLGFSAQTPELCHQFWPAPIPSHAANVRRKR